MQTRRGFLKAMALAGACGLVGGCVERDLVMASAAGGKRPPNVMP